MSSSISHFGLGGRFDPSWVLGRSGAGVGFGEAFKSSSRSQMGLGSLGGRLLDRLLWLVEATLVGPSAAALIVLPVADVVGSNCLCGASGSALVGLYLKGFSNASFIRFTFT